ncbi:unnamed protein product [Ambrosiozyma monospora]|uniref:Unnamed protein product n=1 Tax=Ambrosiozyma monospora TaxID=43982 RepID=A0ACB5TVU9_AMBMO|nr:unnamed protein product [Ambrosiozyma monospora]
MITSGSNTTSQDDAFSESSEDAVETESVYSKIPNGAGDSIYGVGNGTSSTAYLNPYADMNSTTSSNNRLSTLTLNDLVTQNSGSNAEGDAHSINEILDQIEDFYTEIKVEDQVEIDGDNASEKANDAVVVGFPPSLKGTIEHLEITNFDRTISAERNLKKEGITMKELLLSLHLTDLKPKFQGTFTTSTSKITSKKLIVTCLSGCILITDGRNKVRVLATEYLQAAVYINVSSSKDNIIELFNSANGYRLLLKNNNTTEFQLLAGCLTSELKKQMKKFDNSDDVEIVSLNDFYFNYIKQPEQLHVGDVFSSVVFKIRFRKPVIQIISNLYKVISFQYNNEWFLIAAGENGYVQSL